jgi:hypothetical protein
MAPGGCRAQAPANPQAEPSPATEVSEETAQELERLRALGYVDYSPEDVEPGQSGGTVHDERRAYPGYSLYPIRPLGRAELVDNQGNLVHAWFEQEERAWRRSVLLDDGDLLVVGGIKPETYALRLTWDSEVVWRIPLSAHHDIGIAPDGRFITMTMEQRMIPAVHATVPVRDNLVAIFDPAHEGTESVSLYEALAASPDVLPFTPVPAARGVVDVIHANSVRFMTQRNLEQRHAMYDPGNLILCMRNQDSIGVLDWDQRKFVWAWGKGVLEAPHDATVLDNGNILVFDNGIRRKWSRVIEMNPLTGKIVWEYRASDPQEFFTESRGSAQRLPNGNTLISESNSGRGFEVTPDGEIVWEYYQPHLNQHGRRAVIVRFYRYEADVIEPLLAKFRDERP